MAISAYTPIGWKDSPDKTTPLTAANLNKMDNQIAIHNSTIIDVQNAIGDTKISVLTQTEYDALTVKDANTLYFIKPESEESS